MLPLLLAAAAASSFTGAARAEACGGKLGWTDPAPPARIFANVYDVGTCGISAILLVGDKGDILIDTGPTEAAPIVLQNLRRLGVRPGEVKILLATHEHSDHVGGFEQILAATGAKAWLSPGTARALEAGAVDPADPQFGSIAPPPKAPVARRLGDGEVVRLGSLRVVSYATPGHSLGGESYAWRSCAAGRCLQIAYADSLTAVSRKGYRFSEHPERVAALRQAIARVRGMPCDVLLTPHPEASDMTARVAGEKPLIDPLACATYAERARAGIESRLAKEASDKSSEGGAKP